MTLSVVADEYLTKRGACPNCGEAVETLGTDQAWVHSRSRLFRCTPGADRYVDGDAFVAIPDEPTSQEAIEQAIETAVDEAVDEAREDAYREGKDEGEDEGRYEMRKIIESVLSDIPDNDPGGEGAAEAIRILWEVADGTRS